MFSLIIASMLAGNIIASNGKYKLYPIIGAITCIFGFSTMLVISYNTNIVVVLFLLSIIGFGIGLFIQVAVLVGQNAVDCKYLGVATGTLNFFKTIGGAVGAAVFASILNYNESKVGQLTNLGDFHRVYLWCIPLLVIVLVIALLLKEQTLSEEIIKVTKGELEAPEY